MLKRRAAMMAALLIGMSGAARADDILDAMGVAQKAYQAGDLANAKQSLDVASQLIAQKNAEGFAALLPEPLHGWKSERQKTTASAAVFGGSVASRRYSNAKDEEIEVQITGDSAMVVQYATFLNNPQFAGAMGKLVRVGSQRAIQTPDGDIQMVIANKFLVTVQGSGSSADKIGYAQAVDIIKLTKM
jgi:hypothetical protein